MCGIVGYLGTKEAYPILVNGLKRLEYRGYDSAGIALLNEETLNIYKQKGKVAELEALCEKQDKTGHIGIGHTRWATHGEANQVNAHPHTTEYGNLAMVHNGIIENYSTLKTELRMRGHHFQSETDSEVLIHLIEEIQKKGDFTLEDAVRLALKKVVGAYAIVVMSKNDPEKLVAAKKSSPLALGLKEGEFFIGSDVTPFLNHTNKVIYMKDHEIATVRTNGDLTIRTIENEPIHPFIEELSLNLDTLEKGEFDHYMLKEIYEQPDALTTCLRGRLNREELTLELQAVKEHGAVFQNANRIIIVSCGTSWHSGLVGEYWLEELAGIPVEVEYASEFRYREPIIRPDDVVIAISQSGETADTLAAIELAKSKGAFVFGICNVVGSAIAREADAGMYTHAGPEIGVASTKAFTTQLLCLYMLAVELGRLNNRISNTQYWDHLSELVLLEQKIGETLELNEEIASLSEYFMGSTNFMYLGRGYNFPVALEGALKLKEISYIHAEGYPAAEMKHGPIALVDEQMPCLVLANTDKGYDKVISNMQEIKARKGYVVAVAFKGDHKVKEIADKVIYIPRTNEQLSAVVATIPLQLLAYHIATLKGCDVDQPRNLAKSVTVE
ncbi:MAG: glutamine--fructose-6-phosphate transaminase (isomerizing) [Owenweeksia sp.]